MDLQFGKIVNANGIRTNCLEEGNGPPLVLIPRSGPGVPGCDQVIPIATTLRLHNPIKRSQLHIFGRWGQRVQVENNASFCGGFMAGEMG